MALKVSPFYQIRLVYFSLVIQEIALSSGSACTSASLEPSYVLRALGWCTSSGQYLILTLFSGAAEDMAHSSLRFGIGRFTTEAEIDFVVDRIIKTVHRLREMRYCSVRVLLSQI